MQQAGSAAHTHEAHAASEQPGSACAAQHEPVVGWQASATPFASLSAHVPPGCHQPPAALHASLSSVASHPPSGRQHAEGQPQAASQFAAAHAPALPEPPAAQSTQAASQAAVQQ